MPNVSLGRKLQNFRVIEGLTQRQFAEKTKLTQAAISQFESDKRVPSGESLRKMAQGLGISADKLLAED